MLYTVHNRAKSRAAKTERDIIYGAFEDPDTIFDLEINWMIFNQTRCENLYLMVKVRQIIKHVGQLPIIIIDMLIVQI